MPLPTDEKLIALSEELLKQFDAIFGLNPGFSAGACEGHNADRDVYAFDGCRFAYECAAYCAGVDAGDGAILKFDRSPTDSG